MKTRTYLATLALFGIIAAALTDARPPKRVKRSPTPAKQEAPVPASMEKTIALLHREQSDLLQTWRRRAKRTSRLRKKNHSLVASIERLKKESETA